MVEDYLRSRLQLLLHGFLQCPQQGDAGVVDLDWVGEPPVDNVELAEALCKALAQPANVCLIAHELTGHRPTRFTTTEWDIGPWVCIAEHNRIVLRTKAQPSAHMVLTVVAVQIKLQTMDIVGLLGPAGSDANTHQP